MPPETPARARSSTNPILAGYQRRYLRDRSKRKLVVKARRIGFSWVVGLENALSAIGLGHDYRGAPQYRPERGCDQYIVSASHRQSKELLEYVGTHLDVLQEVVLGKKVVASQSAERITLTNGVKLQALAPNPRTIRGVQGDLTLDEFAFMPQLSEVWRAAKSVTDATLGRPYGYKLRIVSTPFGDEGKFYDFAETAEGKRFSTHRVNIYDAIRDGFPRPMSEEEAQEFLQALKDEAGDSDTFAQEYEGVFLSAQARYISAALWDAAAARPEDRPRETGTGFAGYDVARKPTGDMIAACELRRLGDVLWQDAECWTDRGLDWDAQEAKAAQILERCARLAVDATGLGNQFAERLVKAFGGRIDAVEFTPKSKEELATGLRLSLERGKLRPLSHDTDLRTAVLSIRRETTTAGNVRYDAPRTKAGHADQAWALALAVKAAGDIKRGGLKSPRALGLGGLDRGNPGRIF